MTTACFVLEGFSPPSPVDFGHVYLDKSDWGENEEEADNGKVVGVSQTFETVLQEEKRHGLSCKILTKIHGVNTGTMHFSIHGAFKRTERFNTST